MDPPATPSDDAPAPAPAAPQFAMRAETAMAEAMRLLFNDDNEELRRFLDSVLRVARPLVFATYQAIVYRALYQHGAFREVPKGTSGALEVLFLGDEYGVPGGGRVSYYDTVQFCKGLCAILVSTMLHGKLTSLAQLPRAIGTALLFHQRSVLRSDGFWLRQWARRTLFAADALDMDSWCDTSGPVMLLQTPEMADVVWPFGDEHHDAAAGMQSSDAVTLSHQRLKQVSSSPFDPAHPVVMRMAERSRPRELLAFHTFFFLRMAMLRAPDGQTNLYRHLDDLHQLFEPCAALLFGLTDRHTLTLLSRLPSGTLMHLATVAQEMANFLAAPTRNPDTMVASMYARTYDFPSVYVSLLYGSCETLERSRTGRLEATYAPIAREPIDGFVAALTDSAQVLQLGAMRTRIPELARLDAPEHAAAIAAKYGAWVLPPNANQHVLAWSITLYMRMIDVLYAGTARASARAAWPYYVGLHHARGPFVVAQYELIHMLQINMLCHALRQRAIKTTSAFPLLVRMYLLNYAHTSRHDIHLMATELARNAFVQVLAHWLCLRHDTAVTSIGVPGPAEPAAFEVLSNIHRIVAILWPAGAAAAAPLGYDRLTALREALVLREPHWLPHGVLVELARAVDADLGRADPDAVLVLAMAACFCNATYAVQPSGARKVGRPATKRLACLPSGELPLAATAENWDALTAMLAHDHPFRAHGPAPEAAAARTLALNTAVYRTLTRLAPLRTDDLCARVLLAMRTSAPPLNATRYVSKLYKPFSGSRDVRAAYDSAWLSAADTERGLPRPGQAPYVQRGDATIADVMPMLDMLRALEALVCDRSSGPAGRVPQQDAVVAATLSAYMTRRTGPPPVYNTPVGTYYDSDAKAERIVTFDDSISLVQLALSSVIDTAYVSKVRDSRRTFGAASRCTADIATNIVCSIVENYDHAAVDDSAAVGRCLARVLEIKQQAAPATKSAAADAPTKPAPIGQPTALAPLVAQH